jgi:hypothetical protein
LFFTLPPEMMDRGFTVLDWYPFNWLSEAFHLSNKMNHYKHFTAIVLKSHPSTYSLARLLIEFTVSVSGFHFYLYALILQVH